MIFGHITATFLAVKAVKRDANKKIVAVTLFGAFVPDFVDKGLFVLNLGQPRGYGHTLLFFVLLGLLSAALSRWELVARYKTYLKWFVFGFFCHLVEDFVVPQTLLWPFLGPMPDMGPKTFPEMFRDMYMTLDWWYILFPELACHLGVLIYFLRKYMKTRRLQPT